MDASALVRELERAARTFDRAGVALQCETLTADLWVQARPLELQDAKAVLDILRRKRYFALMIDVAEALIQTGQDAPRIRRLYAQALIDSDQTVAALAVLRVLRQDCEAQGDAAELAEALGLIGRAHKQIYVTARSAGSEGDVGRHLLAAIDSYAVPFDAAAGLNLWHGINTVALLCRAQRDNIEIDSPPIDIGTASKAILAHIKALTTPEIWDCATAAEACVAMSDYSQALEWLGRYTSSAAVDAFECASTLRQFEQVWQLDHSEPPQAALLHTLRAALLALEGGELRLEHALDEVSSAQGFLHDAGQLQQRDNTQFEKVFGGDRYKSFKWYVDGLNQARAVAVIEDAVGNGHGTGFLLPGSDVHPSISDEWVLVTNAHVLSDDPAEHAGSPSALPPDEVQVRLEASDTPDATYEIEAILFSSGRTELDCTIATLSEPVACEQSFRISKHLPLADGQQRVYVIGHPGGGKLSFSLHDNFLLDHEVPRLHYRAPTEGGSSGSPVFNSTWRLIGLHHAGGSKMGKLNGEAGVYEANEGISMTAIIEAVAAALG